MTFGLPGSRPGARALVAFLALVAVLWLNVFPHRHSDDWSERHCAACQVVRGNGEAARDRTAALPPPPADSTSVSSPVPDPFATIRYTGPSSGLSPPVSFS